jgi:pathogenesis-related protein 1
VATYAETYAAKRTDCQLVHSPEGRPYGENIYWQSGNEWTAVDAVNFWAAEKQYYDHDTNTCSAPSGQSCGHYTQVVWSDTVAIGCGGVVCDGATGVFIICSYSPPGNVEGQAPY